MPLCEAGSPTPVHCVLPQEQQAAAAKRAAAHKRKASEIERAAAEIADTAEAQVRGFPLLLWWPAQICVSSSHVHALER